jgi:uncharacterized protein with HEPN domain
MRNKSPEIYIQDIKDSIKKIGRYVEGMNFQKFEEDEKTVDAVIRSLEVIGEAANNIPDEFKKKHEDIPWEKIISMRNKMIHEYFGIDLEIVWETIKTDIIDLSSKLDK